MGSGADIGPTDTASPAPSTASDTTSSQSFSASSQSSSVAPPARTTEGATSSRSVLPEIAHIVVIVEENRSADDILGNPAAPYINSLAQSGATLTNSYAITHPSEPNYVALFSGSTQGLATDACPLRFDGANLAAQLASAGKDFRGYSEGLPQVGFTGCTAGAYARKHAPWTNFANVPDTVNQPFTAFPSDYTQLPAVSFVIPNLDHDMHNGTIAEGDAWLRTHLGDYVDWATTHDSLLVLTWDEDDGGHGNRIPTIIVGAHVQPGSYGEYVNHYRLLRTLDELEGLPPTGDAASATPITDIWAG
ncbi:MAG: acid phosphatase [Actinobacteria bacterium]|nr:acid phosphatase [Actinomycetota bacterium]